MRSLVHIAVGFVAVVVTAAAWTSLFGVVRVAPVPMAVTALYLGLTSRGMLAAPIAASLAVGYGADIVLGTPVGLMALVSALICFGGHVAQGRFVIRGLIASAIATASAAIVFLVLLVLVSRAVGLAGAGQLAHSLPLATGAALATGVLGPILLAVHRRLDARLARTQRDRDAALEGVSAS